MYIAAPSILSADFSKLLEEVKSVNSAKFLHIDVMDGHFVPNITIGPLVVKSLKGKVDMVFDCHLMISDPYKYVKAFVESGAHIITFHYEALKNKEEIIELINYIHSFDIHAGIYCLNLIILIILTNTLDLFNSLIKKSFYLLIILLLSQSSCKKHILFLKVFSLLVILSILFFAMHVLNMLSRGCYPKISFWRINKSFIYNLFYSL